MKKLLTLTVSMLMILSLLSGCGGGSSNSTEQPAEPEASDNTGPQDDIIEQLQSTGQDFTIGLVQLVEHPSLDTIRESFLEELDALGYGSVDIDYKNGQNDMSTLNTIAQTFVGNDVDVIVAIATPAAQSAAAATEGTDIPVVFSAATDPIAAGLVTDLNAPDGNVTGVSDAIPVQYIFELAAQLTPDAKTFGLIYNLGEVNSVSVINEVKAYCDENGLEYLEATVADTSEVQQAALSLVGKVEAYFSPIDNTVASAMPVYSQVGLDNQLPIYPAADSMVEDGALATVGIDYTLLGAETARMTVALLEGTQVADLPVVTMTNFRAVANQSTADALEVDLSGVENLEIVSGQ